MTSSIVMYRAHTRHTFAAANFEIKDKGLPEPREFLVVPWHTMLDSELRRWDHLAIALKFPCDEDATIFKMLAPDNLFTFSYDNEGFKKHAPVWDALPPHITSKTMLSWRLTYEAGRQIGYFR